MSVCACTHVCTCVCVCKLPHLATATGWTYHSIPCGSIMFHTGPFLESVSPEATSNLHREQEQGPGIPGAEERRGREATPLENSITQPYFWGGLASSLHLRSAPHIHSLSASGSPEETCCQIATLRQPLINPRALQRELGLPCYDPPSKGIPVLCLRVSHHLATHTDFPSLSLPVLRVQSFLLILMRVQEQAKRSVCSICHMDLPTPTPNGNSESPHVYEVQPASFSLFRTAAARL